MIENHATRLHICLEQPGGDSLDDANQIKTCIDTDMTDCSVHAWFKVFEQLLHMVGFTDPVIMRGGAQLAFNESRNTSQMRDVAKEWDLVLLEDTFDEQSVGVDALPPKPLHGSSNLGVAGSVVQWQDTRTTH